MRILVLGGTQFLGRHVVDAALARGHDVTLFNRGQTRPELFPDVEKLRGDRDGDLSALDGRAFDAVVDTSGYVPRIVARDARRARRRRPLHVRLVGLGLRRPARPRRPRRRPVRELDQPTEEWREAYGELKADCEDVVRERFPDAFIPRPGLIVGPWDPTGRFTYWPERIADGGQVLAPAPPDAPRRSSTRATSPPGSSARPSTALPGTYNAVDHATTRAAMFETCVDGRRLGRRARLGRRRLPGGERGRRVDGAAALAARRRVPGNAVDRRRRRRSRPGSRRGRSPRRSATRSPGCGAARRRPTHRPVSPARRNSRVLDAWLSKE